MTSIFKSDEFNFDSKQSLELEKNKNKLIETHNFNSKSNIDSIKEASEDLGCTGNKCSKLENDEVINFGQPENSNQKLKNNQEKKESYNIFSELFKNSGKNVIYFLYILLVSILLTYTILEKNITNLIIILVLTIIFIFYNLYFKL